MKHSKGKILRIIFAGTPSFAEKALSKLISERAEIVAVLTQPDRPSGRGQQLKKSPVKELAEKNNITVLQPTSLRNVEIQNILTAYSADIMIVAAYGLILPQEVLNIPKLGCINIHASLLPRWRGAAPIQRAIQAGDKETGITIMKMDSGLDTGNILLKRTCEIEEKDTATSLQEKLAKIGAEAISDALNLLEKGKLNSIAQDNELATYAAKITKEEAKINWQLNSKEIERHIRSYNPVPGASSIINGTKVKIWQSSLTEEGAGLPGEVIEVQKKALKIACGKGALQIEILQKPNAKALPVDQFLQGFMIKAGDRFETS